MSTLFYNPSQETWLSTQSTYPQVTQTRHKTRSKYKPVYTKSDLHPVSSPNRGLFLPISLPLSCGSDVLRPGVHNYTLSLLTEPQTNSHTSLLEALWCHSFYKKIISPIEDNYSDTCTQIAMAISSGAL
jgi:hypothetical protein